MRFLVLIVGVFCCSTSVIFIKIGSTDPIALSAYRLIIGGTFLLPFVLWQKRTPDWPSTGELIRRALPPAFFLGIHFISWITGARMTPSANASLIVNMVPVVMPILLFIVLQEKVSKAEAVGTICAIAGVCLLGLGDFNLSREYALGDAVCFLSMLLYACYLIFARKNKDLPSIYLYVVPVYLIAGFFCLAIAGISALSGIPVVWFGEEARLEWISILGLALIPTVLGHSIVNWALRSIRGQAVVIINLAQFIFAGIMGFLLLGEVPHLVFYLASLLVVSGALIVIRHSRSTP